MKKVICMLVLVSFLLSGCSLAPISSFLKPGIASGAGETKPTETVNPDPTPVVTPEATPAQTPEPVVIYDAFCEAGNYHDDVGNSWDYVLRIPAIQCSGADATRLNQEVFTALYPAVNDEKDAMIGGYSLGICSVDYVVYINELLISIVCETDTDWGFESYYIINFDASAKSEVTREQLLARFGLTEELFLELAVQVMEQQFQQYPVDHDQMYWDRHDKSVAKENFTSDCQLFVNDSGQLCMIVKLYSFAGADYYYHIYVVK